MERAWTVSSAVRLLKWWPMTNRRNMLLPAALLLLAGGGVGGVGGCVSPDRPEIAPRVLVPLAYDEAMALRDWPLTVAEYASGDVIAGPTNVTFEYDTTAASETPSARRRLLAQVAESGIFVANVLLLPVQLVRNPPTEDRRYEGVTIRPTYSAAVPVPGADKPLAVAIPATKPVLEGCVLPATPGTTLPAADPSTRPATQPAPRRSGGGRS